MVHNQYKLSVACFHIEFYVAVLTLLVVVYFINEHGNQMESYKVSSNN